MNLGANWTLSLYDIVGHTIPGIAGLLLILWRLPIDLPGPATLDTLVIVVIGFVFGHFLHALGALLFYAWYKEDFPEGAFSRKVVSFIDRFVSKFQLFKVKGTDLTLKKDLWLVIEKKLGYKPTKKTPLVLFQIADTIVAMNNYEERIVLLAKEAFYRSFSGLVVMSIIFLLLVDRDYWFPISIVGIILVEIFRYQREYYRRIKNNQIYIQALIYLKEI